MNVQHFGTVPSSHSQSQFPKNLLSHSILQYFDNEVISSSAKVFGGRLNGEKVAVKICNKNMFDRITKHQLKLKHPNILHYLFHCKLDTSFYFVSEFYNIPLNNYLRLQIPVKEIMKQLTSAVQYMQEKRIVHLDIAPDNVFIIKHEAGGAIVKLTNFEYAQKLVTNYIKTPNSYYNTASSKGGFTPIEVRNHDIAYLTSDVYSLGRIFYYLMTNGKNVKATANGQKNRNRKSSSQGCHDPYQSLVPFKDITNESNDHILCKDILKKTLIEENSQLKRINAKDMLQHPYFWTPFESLKFILDIAIMLEDANNSDFLTEIKKGSSRAMGDQDWTKRISKNLLTEIQKARKAHCNRIGSNADDVDGSKIKSLISTIRNMWVHNKTQEVIAIVGDTDDGFFHYWTKRFPSLIAHLYESKRKYENKEN